MGITPGFVCVSLRAQSWDWTGATRTFPLSTLEVSVVRWLPLLGARPELDVVLCVLHDDSTCSLIQVVHRIEIYLRFTGRRWRLKGKCLYSRSHR